MLTVFSLPVASISVWILDWLLFDFVAPVSPWVCVTIRRPLVRTDRSQAALTWFIGIPSVEPAVLHEALQLLVEECRGHQCKQKECEGEKQEAPTSRETLVGCLGFLTAQAEMIDLIIIDFIGLNLERKQVVLLELSVAQIFYQLLLFL